MKLGIKVGLKGDPQKDLELTKPDFCEVWFHSGTISKYDDLFLLIKKHTKTAGLHYWGTIDDKILTNISFPDTKVLKESIALIKKTIDVAQKNNFWYVNIHPGGARLIKIDFEKGELSIASEPVDFKESVAILQESLIELDKYAKSRGVQFLVESVPLYSIATGDRDERDFPIMGHEIPLNLLKPVIMDNNIGFTNDFGHTAASVSSESRTQIWKFLQDTTQELASQTKLLHTCYIVPPYNGTDYHGCLYYDEFKTNLAIPNYDEMKSLLKLFAGRNDIGALVEPETNHPDNYSILKQLIAEAS